MPKGRPWVSYAARASLDELDAHVRAIHRKTARIDILSLLALVAEAQGDTSTSFDKLTEALLLAEPGGFVRSFVDLGAPMAVLLERLQGMHKDTLPAISTYIDRILGAFPAHTHAVHKTSASSTPRVPSGVSALVDPLTKREVQILRLLATELSPQEIGDELVVSTATVRTHISNIYQKLDTHSRFEAVHRASELSLI